MLVVQLVQLQIMLLNVIILHMQLVVKKDLIQLMEYVNHAQQMLLHVMIKSLLNVIQDSF